MAYFGRILNKYKKFTKFSEHRCYQRIKGKKVKLSALRTGRLYPQEYPGTHFESLTRPRAHGLVGCLGKKSPVTRPGIDPGTFRYPRPPFKIQVLL
jgi:hypothetical protein